MLQRKNRQGCAWDPGRRRVAGLPTVRPSFEEVRSKTLRHADQQRGLSAGVPSTPQGERWRASYAAGRAGGTRCGRAGPAGADRPCAGGGRMGCGTPAGAAGPQERWCATGAPAFATKFLRDALRPGVREAALFCARKNAKSAVSGGPNPLPPRERRTAPAARVGCGAGLSVEGQGGRALAAMRRHCGGLGLSEVRCGKVPRHVSSRWGRCEFLSADKTAGHASGFDLAVADELGLFPERSGRALVSGCCRARRLGMAG